MKKTLVLIAAFVLAYATSQAQTEKGIQTLGFYVQTYQQNSSGTGIDANNNPINQNSKYSTINIGPQYSYFIADKLDLGASFNYGAQTYNYPSNSVVSEKQTSKSYGATVFLRKYVMFNDKLGLRAGPEFYYTRNNSSTVYTPAGNGYNNVNGKGDSYTLALEAALVYYPTKHLGFSAIFANAGYDYSKTNDGVDGNQTSKDIYLNLINSGLSLSVFYSFGGK